MPSLPVFSVPILPNTKYFIDKLFYPKKWSKFHAVCTQCSQYAGAFEPRKDDNVQCRTRRRKINVEHYDFKDFFVTMEPSNPISELIQTNSDHFNFVLSQRIHEEGLINYIYDGKLYREFVECLNEADKHQ